MQSPGKEITILYKLEVEYKPVWFISCDKGKTWQYYRRINVLYNYKYVQKHNNYHVTLGGVS